MQFLIVATQALELLIVNAQPFDLLALRLQAFVFGACSAKLFVFAAQFPQYPLLDNGERGRPNQSDDHQQPHYRLSRRRLSWVHRSKEYSPARCNSSPMSLACCRVATTLSIRYKIH